MKIDKTHDSNLKYFSLAMILSKSREEKNLHYAIQSVS